MIQRLFAPVIFVAGKLPRTGKLQLAGSIPLMVKAVLLFDASKLHYPDLGAS